MRTLLLMLLLAAPIAHAGESVPACPPMTPFNVFINYAGSSSACVPGFSSPCALGETIQFQVGGFGYSFACSNHTFQWDFGDGTFSITALPTHVYVVPGVYQVKVTITNSQQQLPLTHNVIVSTIGDPPPPFVRQELYDERGRIKRGYIFTIEGATGEGDWIWDFGDGTTVRGPQRMQAHVYKSGGTFTVKLSSASSANTYSMQFSIPIDRRRSARH
jgi:hypothetical protein